MPSSISNNKRLGISLGDPGGIGPEVVAKSLNHPSLRRFDCSLIGDSLLFKKYGLKETARRHLIACDNFRHLREIKTGISKSNGVAALSYLQKAVSLLKKNKIDALITAPVCKEAIAMTKKDFVGHTEFLAREFSCPDVDMMFVCEQMRVVIATRHVPVQKISAALSKKKITDCIRRTHRSLKEDFKIRSPRIAVCGLNPHAGEGGTIGKEEITTIAPAVRQLQRQGLKITGPVAADTIFIKGNRKSFDCIIAMYHDQGLIAAKTLYFDTLVNLTIGLPFIRTSPDHGTAFDIAGRKRANPSSMLEAIKLAHRLA